MLSNDHKALTARIEQLLHQLHYERVGDAQPPERTAAPLHPNTCNVEDEGAGMRAFADIDEVTTASPAAMAGLRVGDKLLALGNVTATTGGVAALPGILQVRCKMTYGPCWHLLQASEGTALRAVVRRDGRSVELQFTPQRWSGRGLLGCHLVPL